jgi:hypothetical protein
VIWPCPAKPTQCCRFRACQARVSPLYVPSMCCASGVAVSTLLPALPCLQVYFMRMQRVKDVSKLESRIKFMIQVRVRV